MFFLFYFYWMGSVLAVFWLSDLDYCVSSILIVGLYILGKAQLDFNLSLTDTFMVLSWWNIGNAHLPSTLLNTKSSCMKMEKIMVCICGRCRLNIFVNSRTIFFVICLLCDTISFIHRIFVFSQSLVLKSHVLWVVDWIINHSAHKTGLFV